MKHLSLTILLLFTVEKSFGYDFSTPQAAVESYQEALDKGDQRGVEDSFDSPAKGFYRGSGEKDSKSTSGCHIISSKPYSKSAIQKWNKAGTVPSLETGDVKVIQSCKKEPTKVEFSLRKKDSGWKIISHAAYGDDT